MMDFEPITATDVILGGHLVIMRVYFCAFLCACLAISRPQYKCHIRLEKSLIVEEFIKDWADLPLSVVYGLDSPGTLFG